MSIENINLSGGSGVPAVGTILSVLTQTSPGDYLAIGNLGNWDLPLGARCRRHHQPGAPSQQSIGTLFDGGKISTEIHFLPGCHAHRSFVAHSATGFRDRPQPAVSAVQHAAELSRSRAKSQQCASSPAHITKYPMTFDLTKDIMPKIEITVSCAKVFSCP